jgi:hypothetical protein
MDLRILSRGAIAAIVGATMLAASSAPAPAFTLSSPSLEQPIVASGVDSVYWPTGVDGTAAGITDGVGIADGAGVAVGIAGEAAGVPDTALDPPTAAGGGLGAAAAAGSEARTAARVNGSAALALHPLQ